MLLDKKSLCDCNVFSRPGVKVWKCRNCGHLHVGPEAPKVCPVCNHPQAFFEEQAINY